MANEKENPPTDVEETQTDRDEFDDLYYDDPYGTVTNQDIEVTLFSWYGPSHVKRRATKRYYLNLGLLAAVIILILVFLQQFYLMMMVGAVVFLLVVMTIADPKPIRHVITNFGIYSGNNFYPWEIRGKYFWIEKDQNERLLVVQIKKFPYQIVMLLNEKIDEEQLVDLLDNFMKFKKPKKNGIDKFITWWKRTFPLDW